MHRTRMNAVVLMVLGISAAGALGQTASRPAAAAPAPGPATRASDVQIWTSDVVTDEPAPAAKKELVAWAVENNAAISTAEVTDDAELTAEVVTK